MIRGTPAISVPICLVFMVSVGCGTGTLHGSHYDAGQDTIAPGDSMEKADAPTTMVNLSFPIRPAPRLDLLFVVDNGPSMATKQPKLAAELAKIISGLSNSRRETI